MSRRHSHSARTALCLLLIAAAALGACGKKGPLRAPEGEESRYTYPRFYPAPAAGTVTTGRTAQPPGEVEEEPPVRPLADEPSPLSPFPDEDERSDTEVFGSVPE